jgi:hypothetical protein
VSSGKDSVLSVSRRQVMDEVDSEGKERPPRTVNPARTLGAPEGNSTVPVHTPRDSGTAVANITETGSFKGSVGLPAPAIHTSISVVPMAAALASVLRSELPVDFGEKRR